MGCGYYKTYGHHTVSQYSSVVTNYSINAMGTTKVMSWAPQRSCNWHYKSSVMGTIITSAII